MGNLNWGRRAYGVLLLCVATAIASPAQTFKTLHSFDGTDGSYPHAGLVQATNGSLYGTTDDTPKAEPGVLPSGTVFDITPSGALTTLHGFCLQSGCPDGSLPFAGLVQATDGNFYGTTWNAGPNGYGTVFKISPSGTLTTLHGFDGTDGNGPTARLVQATDGNFYGTTSQGGANNLGTVFRITPSGNLTTLHSFDGNTDGSSPYGGLVQATDGNLYGTTSFYGAHGYGTVFKISTSGTLTTLYSFCSQSGCTDGESPYGGLVQATDGNFYGKTSGGGANVYYGTVFKITPSGTLTTLYSFCSKSGCTDGSEYQNQYADGGGLVQATDGNFYGTTLSGGANVYYGTVFKITPSGALTTLYSFCSQNGVVGCTDGASPYAGLVQATDGNFYGTTSGGGANSDGTIFSLSVGLGRFVETLPTSGKVGAAVKILGTNLTGATSVSFNGTAATFKVVSSSEITTTVPVGATSGFVKVTTPGKTLKSNMAFRVRP
jgi:uncharacterized repeat protein (TIGR03803 family)